MTAIRPVRPEDREAIRSMIEGTKAFQPHEVEVAMELVDTALAYRHPPGDEDYHAVVLAEEDGTVVSYACFGKNPMTAATWDLYWLATRPDRMGKGYGRAIVRHVEEEVRRRGGRLLVIETSSKESYGGTQAFYEKIGCTLAARIPDYYDRGDDKLVYLIRLS
ncbi:MAG: hypothetical protein Kow00128_23370 [Deltaproteobacteria bacterium]